MKLFTILSLPALLLAPLPVLCAADASPSGKPNIIFILTDDQGWGDAGFAGHPYLKTPSLDKFASESTWLRQFYVAATVCSPSRAAFMTSRNPARDRIHAHFADHSMNAERYMPNWLDEKTPTLASLLKDAGYATAHFGKWHLGRLPGAPPPTSYGFDVAKSFGSSGTELGDQKNDPYFWANFTTKVVDETINFIREHKEGPFYVNVWPLLPHAPLKPTPEQLAVYSDLAPSATDPAFSTGTQDYLGKANDLKSQMQIYGASITDLDTQLGRLFAALDEMKLADNTIVFFSSDNGPEDYRVGNASNSGVGSAGPLRARKRSLYEGGIRTLGLVRWPGHVPAGRRDESSVTSGVDFLPTICKLANVEIPSSVQPDGEDVSDIWLGKSRPRTKPLHWEWLFNVVGGKDDGYQPPMLAVRDGDWKLFVNHNGSGAQLYNIPKDIGEEHDLAGQNPDVVKSLTAKALAWVKSLPAHPTRAAKEETHQP